MSLLFSRLFLTSLLIDSYGVRFRAALGLLPYILIFFRWYFIRSKILLKHLTTFWGIGYWWDILSNSGDTLQSCTWKFQKIIKKCFLSVPSVGCGPDRPALDSLWKVADFATCATPSLTRRWGSIIWDNFWDRIIWTRFQGKFHNQQCPSTHHIGEQFTLSNYPWI